MQFQQQLARATLIRRYKRFLADVTLPSGRHITVHCPNSGSMQGCAVPGSPVLLSFHESPTRKLAYTLEMVQRAGVWIGINTGRPNHLVREALEQGRIPELEGYDSIRAEVPYGTRSRIDLLLEKGTRQCYVEIKNVTLVEAGQALFPDAVTKRGQKHLRELARVVQDGKRGVIFFLVQRGDAARVAPADAIDPEYGRLLREVAGIGVEVLAYRAAVTPQSISLEQRLPVEL